LKAAHAADAPAWGAGYRRIFQVTTAELPSRPR